MGTKCAAWALYQSLPSVSGPVALPSLHPDMAAAISAGLKGAISALGIEFEASATIHSATHCWASGSTT
ncbi:hypothetical protein DVH05_019146 [Phytophthora capsici]|nr:hypothetical protein DVH05_019146 [Phytophthora capsici]